MADTKEQKQKTYSMTAEEVDNLMGRRAMYRHENYVRTKTLQAIEADMDSFVDDVVRKRLNLSKEQLIQIDLDKGIVIMVPAQPKKEEKPAILDTNGKPAAKQ